MQRVEPTFSDLEGFFVSFCVFNINFDMYQHKDIHKSDFRTKYDQFELAVLPFGLANSPSIFQCFMNDIFRDLIDEYVFVYIDDILIASPDEKYHETHLSEVLS